MPVVGARLTSGIPWAGTRARRAMRRCPLARAWRTGSIQRGATACRRSPRFFQRLPGWRRVHRRPTGWQKSGGAAVTAAHRPPPVWVRSVPCGCHMVHVGAILPARPPATCGSAGRFREIDTHMRRKAPTRVGIAPTREQKAPTASERPRPVSRLLGSAVARRACTRGVPPKVYVSVASRGVSSVGIFCACVKRALLAMPPDAGPLWRG